VLGSTYELAQTRMAPGVGVSLSVRVMRYHNRFWYRFISRRTCAFSILCLLYRWYLIL